MLLVLPLFGIGQSKDFQVWTGADVKYKLNKKISFGLEQALRTGNNSLLVDKTFTEFNVSFDLPKKMTLVGGYRFMQNYIGENSNGHRIFTQYKIKYKLDRIKIGYRLMYQYQVKNENATHALRNQLKVNYNIPKISVEPFVAAESFYTFFRGFDKYRLSVGLSESFGKKLEGSIFYRYQREVNNTYVQQLNILGIGISYDLGKKKKKKVEE